MSIQNTYLTTVMQIGKSYVQSGSREKGKKIFRHNYVIGSIPVAHPIPTYKYITL